MSKDYLEAFQARRSFLLKYRLRRHDGEYRWIMDCGAPFEDDAGNFAGYLGACYDITQQKRAEDALRTSEKLFAAFMDHWPGFSWMKDLDGRVCLWLGVRKQIGRGEGSSGLALDRIEDVKTS